MHAVNENCEKSLESIANRINKNLIPALNKATFELDTQVQDSKFLTLESIIINIAAQALAIQ